MTTPQTESAMTVLVKRFRNRILDTDPLENLLKGTLEFSNEAIEGFIIESLYDINEAEPRRNQFTLQQFPKTSLLLDGAMVMMLRGRGLLHLRNQISYSDAGFSVNVDDKSGHYAQWLSQVNQNYLQDRKEFKRSFTPRFRGVDSPLGRWY
jgi:hypothetical protein